jgi:hypothetical protein
MLLSLIMKRLISVVAVLAMVSLAEAKNVCDLHLSQIKRIPFEGNAGVDPHYDALKAAERISCALSHCQRNEHKTQTRSASYTGMGHNENDCR